jgi:predicted RNA methylase
LNNQAQVALDQIIARKTQATEEELGILAQYTGTGGVGDSLNEYYTPEAVAAAMWRLAAKAGFAGGAVLEPSCGTGVFLRTAPRAAVVTGVEMSKISAGIAAIIHKPAGHEIINDSFEGMATSDPRRFGLVIGNPPFGIRGATVQIDRRHLSTAQEYFLDASIDKTAPGGIVALILPTSIMDGGGQLAKRRTEMLLKAEFITAWRMPNSTFRDAHTNIPIDILLLRKRDDDVIAAASVLYAEDRISLGLSDDEIVEGRFFQGRGAANVLGEIVDGWRSSANMGQDFAVRGSLEDALAALEAWSPVVTRPVTLPQLFAAAGNDVIADRMRRAILTSGKTEAKHGDVRVAGGVRYQMQAFEGERGAWVAAPAPLPPAVTAAHDLGMSIELLVSRGISPDQRQRVLSELAEFEAMYGSPAANRDIAAWLREPYWPLGAEETRDAHKSALSSAKRSVGATLGAIGLDGMVSDLLSGEIRDAPVLNAAGAIAAAGAILETFTIADVVATAAATPEEILDLLRSSDDYAIHPDGVTWEARDRYLSGDLWPKLDAAVGAAADPAVAGWVRDRIVAQAKTLEDRISPISLEFVEIAINSGFITADDISAWLEDRYLDAIVHRAEDYSRPQPAAVRYDRGYYAITPTNGATHISSFNQLLSNYLNREGVRNIEIPLVDAMNAEFRLWVLSGRNRDLIEQRYNRSYRGFVQREYSTAPISIPGLNPDRKLNQYHFGALRWALDTGKGIVAYDVGVGKTTMALLLGRLAAATGRARRIAYFVPLNVTANWEAEAKSWFPDARILVIGETKVLKKDGTFSAKSDSAAVIRAKLQATRQNSYDFIFITEPAWNRLDLAPETKASLMDRDFWVQRGEAMGHAGTKRQTKIREAYEQSVAGRNFNEREDTIYFDDLGFDLLIGDELHRYKNLFSARNRWGSQPKFLGGSGQSNRAYDTYLKASFLRENVTGGSGVFGLTASPTKNSPLEIYSILSHVAPESFERMGIRNAEEFLDRFCVFEIQPVLNLKGEIEDCTVVSGFKNLDELLPVMNRFIYRKTAADVGLKIPAAEPVVHLIDMSPTQKGVYEKIRESMVSRDGDVPNIHIFKALDQMGKASLDLTLIDPLLYADERSPIIDTCVQVATSEIRETGDAQLIFCDYIDLHEKIKIAFVDAGIPSNRIVVMNAGTVPRSEDRYRVQEAYNRGEYDVVIGNAAVIGEGINLMVCTGGSHVLSIPWDPDTLKQIRGRGRRQGNFRELVREHVYFDKGGVSAYRYQVLSGKQDWSDVLWSGVKTVENPASSGGYSRIDLMIMLSTDPIAAREKYDSDLEAANQRHAEAARLLISVEFRRLQEMQSSFRALGAQAAETPSGTRLGRALELLREKIGSNNNFGPKEALEDPTATLYFPIADQVVRVGDVVTIRAGKFTGDQASRQIVLSIDWKSETIELTAFETVDDHTESLSRNEIEEMLNTGRGTITPGHAHDRPRIIAEKLRTEPSSGNVVIRSFKNLRLFGDSWIEANSENLQKHILRAITQSRIDAEFITVVRTDGSFSLLRKFDASVLATQSGKGDGTKLVLPTEANRRTLIDLAVSTDREKNIQMLSAPQGRSGSTIKYVIGEKFGDHFIRTNISRGHSNPAIEAIQTLFGKEGVAAGLAAAKADAVDALAQEIRPTEILKTAIRLLEFPGYNEGIHWKPDVALMVVRQMAKAGRLDERMDTLVQFSDNKGSPGLSRAYLLCGPNGNVQRIEKSATMKHYLATIAQSAGIIADVEHLLRNADPSKLTPTLCTPMYEASGPSS